MLIEMLNDENNKKKLEKILEKLELYFPERKVFALDSIDKTLRENISAFAKELGFSNTEEFLNKLRYTIIKGEEVKQLRNKVIYAPGNEPDFIKNKVISICERLNDYYPDKEINRGMQNDHKALSKDISGMYQWLGYTNIKSFLEAYGFNYNIDSEVGGRPAIDYDSLIEYLVNKYSVNPIYSSVTELANNEPYYCGNIKTLSNRSSMLFGMSLGKYLQDKNVLIKETPKSEILAARRQEEQEKKEKIIKDKIYEKIVNGNYDVNVEMSKYDDLIVEYRANGDSLLLRGIKNKKEIMEIPYGIKKITDSFYNSLEGVEKLIVSESVESINYYGLNDISSLKEIVLTKPKFRLKDEFFDRFIITLDIHNEINDYLMNIDINLREKYAYYIDVILKCLRIGRYNKKILFFIDRKFKLVFVYLKKVYYTNVDLTDNVEIFDNILEGLFKRNWIYCFSDMYTEHRNLKEICLDNEFNVMEGDKNEN